MDWDTIRNLLEIAEMSRGYGENSPIKKIHDAALNELSRHASSQDEEEEPEDE
jgi:hypothetical protein